MYAHETGLAERLHQQRQARSANECWFAHDKGLGVVADFPTDTVVAYTRDPQTLRGKAQIYRCGKLLQDGRHGDGVPHNFIINLDHDGNDTWVATGKGPRLGDRRRILRRASRRTRLARDGSKTGAVEVTHDSSCES